MEYSFFKYKRNSFLKSVKNFEHEQERVLFKIINSNKNTKYGIKYGFSKIKTIKEFQKYVPISIYENYESYISEILNGKNNILTKEKILLLEPTSGSSSQKKYIPYTKSLKKAFNYGIEPWLSDLFVNYPELLDLKMYWSITPSIKIDEAASKIKIGFENDFEYLNEKFANLIIKNALIPPICDNTEKFQTDTAAFLEKQNNLGLISIWNPYLLILFIRKMSKQPKDIWKNLSVISCWDDGYSKMYADKLKEMFPNTYIQGKGLLATEGIMTIPIINIGKLPCVKSHFFEFIDIETNKIKLLSDLKIGNKYSILLTTQGGLYRYKIGDIVKVYGKYNRCPLLSFEGREDSVSDYFGEKLNEDFVLNILKKYKIDKISDFYLFTPNFIDDIFNYVLYLDTNKHIDFMELEKNIELELSKNFHYNYARKLGQIADFKIYIIKNGMKQYLDYCIKKGQKMGDIKPKHFSNCANYNFVGEFVL